MGQQRKPGVPLKDRQNICPASAYDLDAPSRTIGQDILAAKTRAGDDHRLVGADCFITCCKRQGQKDDDAYDHCGYDYVLRYGHDGNSIQIIIDWSMNIDWRDKEGVILYFDDHDFAPGRNWF